VKRIAQAGLRFKIMVGALVLLLLLAGAVTMTYAIVRQVENKTGFLVAFDDVLRATLELRRFEKNYFLFRTEKDYQEALRYLSRLNELVVRYRNRLENVLDSAELTRLSDDLTTYERLMRMVHTQESSSIETAAGEAARTRIRELGQEVTVFAEDTARQQRGDVQILLGSVKRVLVWSTLFIVIVLVAIALFVGRGVVNSLKTLEGYTRRIARGDFIDVPVKVADKEIVSLLLAFRRMTNELRARQQRLVQSEKLASLGTLVAGVAHELNNPLSNISTSAQILREELMAGDPELQRELLGQVEDQADRARDIVKSLLEFSRVREIRLEPLFCADLFRETLLLLRGQMPSHVTVDMEVEEGLCISADKQQLQQVFLNLIKNAMDAVGEQGMIWITADKVTRPGKKDMVEIMIEDNGAGIPQEQVKRIFDPFFTTKDVGHGTGLGLFLVHDIVQSHGGSITVDSRLGEGTTLIIWLPAQEKKND